MRKVFPFLFFFIPIICLAQSYKYIGVEDGLSNRRVYSIQKDKKGYMWFLTHDGIDRFDGKQFKHYRLTIGGKDINSFENLNQLYVDTLGCLWEIGKNGQIFRYNNLLDKYQYVCSFDDDNQTNELSFNYAYIDKVNNIWLGTPEKLYIYNIGSQKFKHIKNNELKNISNIVQADKETYFIGTYHGVKYVSLKNNVLNIIPLKSLDVLDVQINALSYQPYNRKLIIGSFLKGIYVYDMDTKEILHPSDALEDINVTCIRYFNENEVLIGTDGAGIYKMDTRTNKIEPFLIADFYQSNQMNGNNINDIFIDDEQRIWIANYPMGITVFNSHFPYYKWIKHAIGNKNSLVNDQVNSIIEDSDGDIWYATNNGISFYDIKKDKWTNMLSSFHKDTHNKNHIFTTLCEVKPGLIWIGGYTSGMYLIDKKEMRPQYFMPSDYVEDVQPDKYIKAIYKDKRGDIWAGGFYNLKRINIENKKIDIFHGIHSITCICEKNPSEMWIGSSNGLFLLNKETKKIETIRLPVESNYINVIHQENNGLLFIGTSGSGLLIYNPENRKFVIYHMDNSALISNSIYSILSDNDGRLILGTENGLSRYSIENKTFTNWTKEQGLMTNHFNAASGTVTRRNTFIIGSGNGAIEFDKNTDLPRFYKTRMVFSDFRLFYQTIHSGEKNSPLKRDIDEVSAIDLSYDQNIFSLRLSSINYDYPSNVVYSWKLDGFYSEWNRVGTENLVRYTNLSPGKYVLRVRAVSKEDRHILEERSLGITIHPPFWKTIWANIIYFAIAVILIWTGIRFYWMRKERKSSTDKINFFVNTAHDIRTPLTLIKAPLDDLLEKEHLSYEGEQNLLMALRSTNNLFRLIGNLIDFEKSNANSNTIHIAEYECYDFLDDIVQQFKTYSEFKQIQFTFETDFRFLNVWFDRHRMESIIKNLISNALKYTPSGGSVSVYASHTDEEWSVEVKDSGIGIPLKEQKYLFKSYFRGTNAINSKVTGSGIGLLLVYRMVRIHKGTINLKSAENQGAMFKVTFPLGNKHYKKEQLGEMVEGTVSNDDKVLERTLELQKVKRPIPHSSSSVKLMIVEDNDELRGYLQASLAEQYSTFVAVNGQEALDLVKAINPDIIISDIMMPVMRGDKLCSILKNDIETSHIPIILLTALNDKDNMMNGLAVKADSYLTKPFDIAILRATIVNLLDNRTLLRQKYTQYEIPEPECKNCATELDYLFMKKVKDSMKEHLSDQNFNVDNLCYTVNMSRSAFFVKLKALTDMSPSELLRMTRLSYSIELLMSEQYLMSEIAEQSGFNDAKYYREVFKKYYHMSPSKYLEEHRK